MIGAAPKASGERDKPVTLVIGPAKRAERPPEAPRADEAAVEPAEPQIVRGVD